MKLIVGLGNPGPKYETTRHNAGFLMVDEIASHYNISWSGQKFNGIVAKGQVLSEDCILLKPQTFMNMSGRSVRAALNFFKLEPQDMVVIYDDIDVPDGKVKARIGGGHGGHNGIRSIMQEGGVSDFHRIKLGVGRPCFGGENLVSNYVLGRLSDDQLALIQGQLLDEVLIRLKNIFC